MCLFEEAFHFRQHQNFDRNWDSLRLIRLLLNKGCEFSEGCILIFAYAVAPFLTAFGYHGVRGMLQQRNSRVAEICCALRELGLDPNSEIHGSLYICHLLSKSPLQVGPLLLSLDNLFAPIAWLCEMGVNVSGTDRFADQPLHILFSRKQSAKLSESVIELAMLLLDYGADPCGLNDRGLPVLVEVVKHGWEDEFIEALSRCGIDLTHVLEETVRRQWRFHYHVAESTALEGNVTEKSSSKGLSRRKVSLYSDRGDERIRQGDANGSRNGEYSPKIDRTDGVAGNKQLILDFLIQTLRLKGIPEIVILALIITEYWTYGNLIGFLPVLNAKKR